MSLHPIRELNRVIDDYKEYLRTEFRAKDENLRAALERELERPLFIAQDPFFQTYRPFRNGKAWRDLPLDAKLAAAMQERARGNPSFLHQSDAIEELLSPAPKPVVVTTGTGSGKTEAFLMPVIQNAIEDVAKFRHSGLTAILVYPMNALANDQLVRIEEILADAGLSGAVTVGKYDRGTPESERKAMRETPPHILLTNYVMLEYLLVRPADREGIFANHRCRFIVLDEVHTYRGSLGSNIALLIRRLRHHLTHAVHDWMSDPPEALQAKRYPSLVPIGTSATIKSVAETGSQEEAIRLRDLDVQDFFGRLTGVAPESIRVYGESLEEIRPPAGAAYPAAPGSVDLTSIDVSDPESVRKALCRLAGVPEGTPVADAANRCKLLWDLNSILICSPRSVPGIVSTIIQGNPERAASDPVLIHKEVETALVVGAALPDGTPGALRLKVHRIIRGGWQFHRCINPDCGRLYPMGEECCSCGFVTAPLYICRNCGADYMRFECTDPESEPLHPKAGPTASVEWVLFEPARFEDPVGRAGDEEEEETEGNGEEAPRRRGRRQNPSTVKLRKVLEGSFDPGTLQFSTNPDAYSKKVVLIPGRTRCFCCGGTAGSRSVITPISIGTSAALKVVTEGVLEALSDANKGRAGHDGKERLLIFSDSRQDAAHQARFIHFAGRYDRMRRNLANILGRSGPIPLQRAVELLGDQAVRDKDNPYVPSAPYVHPDVKKKIQIWEEAPLLDDLAVNAGFRATLPNLGLLGVQYNGLGGYVSEAGGELAASLGINKEQFLYICRCLLDFMRIRNALSRDLLRYNPLHPSCPDQLSYAEWERKIKTPSGFACGLDERPALNPDDRVPRGIKARSLWRGPGRGGRDPEIQRILKNLLSAFGGIEPTPETMLEIVRFLFDGTFLVPSGLFGITESRKFLQVNAEYLLLGILGEAERLRCAVCGAPRHYAAPGFPCPMCHGSLVPWTNAEMARNRNVQRIRSGSFIPLYAGEHTAQITTDRREELEKQFKAPASESKVNVIACSPTMEMGIDVGGLDAIALRNMPPRPDNYAQRGGRAGRRSRVGLVLGYARNTPHDQYFYDKPTEMISGEIPAPLLALGNKDVLLRHANAILFGAATPGLSGKMGDYVTTQGAVIEEKVAELIAALRTQIEYSITTATVAFGSNVLAEAGITEQGLREWFEALPDKVRDVFERTARQVIELRQALDRLAVYLVGQREGVHAAELIRRLLGLPKDHGSAGTDADDHSAGYPLRRFAEFGILPGYEFPTAPATLRLKGDPNEDNPVTVGRVVGIAQFRPEANVYARNVRWKVIGLDPASPWNPKVEGPSWGYMVCSQCALRFSAGRPQCPRCGNASPGRPHPASEFAGFLAVKNETPVFEEEDRIAVRNLVRTYPQWDGVVTGKWGAGGGWTLNLYGREEVRWLNEGMKPTPKDLAGPHRTAFLHDEAKGYLLCGICGATLSFPPAENAGRGRRQAQGGSGNQPDQFGHRRGCPRAGTPPMPQAIVAEGRTEVLRLIIPLPSGNNEDASSFGLSLGYSLMIGMRRRYMLDSSEIDFELEGPWEAPYEGGANVSWLCMSFIDPSVGGTGYLNKAAEEFHLVARRAIEHLDHPNCETACYRCLKSYSNQRFHDKLRWPLVIPVLEIIASEPPVARAPTARDIDDPGPWLEAYAAGVGSPLELKYLRLFEANGFNPVKQYPICREGSAVPFTIADFAVPEKRLAIYIDGASFHVGRNLRRDRRIRADLRGATPPWAVLEFGAQELRRGVELINDIMEKTS